MYFTVFYHSLQALYSTFPFVCRNVAWLKGLNILHLSQHLSTFPLPPPYNFFLSLLSILFSSLCLSDLTVQSHIMYFCVFYHSLQHASLYLAEMHKHGLCVAQRYKYLASLSIFPLPPPLPFLPLSFPFCSLFSLSTYLHCLVTWQILD